MKNVSVIVPAYNSSIYIEKCLDSLVNQSLKNIEIIVIEDCSTDNTKEIIKKYEKKYDNIKAIYNKINKGIGYNRNLGIDKSQGKYIAFVDSDDYIDKDYLKVMFEYSEKNKLDFCLCDLKKVDNSGNILGYEEDIKGFDITNLEVTPELLLKINMGPANKLFKKDIFDKETKFSEKLKYEDLVIIPRLLMNSKRVGKVNNVYYNYVIHNYSETTSMDKRVFDIIEVLKIVNSYISKIEYFDKIKDELEYLNIRTITRYTLQQRFQKDKELKKLFIDKSFEFLNSEFKNWRNNKYLNQENKIKKIIKTNKVLTKFYCVF